MPQSIEVEGHGLVEFPDDATPEEIQGVLRRDFPPEPVGFGDRMAQGFGSFGRGLATTFSSPLKAIATAADYLDRNVLDLTPGDPAVQDRALMQLGRGIESTADRNLPAPDPRLQDSFWNTDLPSGAGQLAGTLLQGGIASGGAKALGRSGLSAAMRAGNISGAAQEFMDSFERAQQAGDNPDTAFKKSIAYASLATAIENRLGTGRLMRKYFPDTPTAAKALQRMGVAGEVAKDVLTGFAEEASQRGAQDLIIDGKLNTEGMAREGAAGAILQGLFGVSANFINRTVAEQQEVNSRTAEVPAKPATVRDNRNVEPIRTEPTADTSADALADLQAAMRGNQMPGVPSPLIPRAAPERAMSAAPSTPEIVETRVEVPAQLSEEERAAVEMVRRQDEKVAEFVKQPDKNYEGMSRLELELLDGMGDARATAALRRVNRRRANRRDAETPREPESGAAESSAPPRLGGEQVPSQPVAFVPESTPSASAETITSPPSREDERTGSAMPAEAGQTVPPALTAPKTPRKSRPQHSIGERPWDVIDEIEAEVGGKIDPSLIRAANPNWKPTGASRKLFRKGGRGADAVLNAITYGGPKLGLQQDTGLQEFGDALNHAATARQGWKSRQKTERTLLDEQAREYETRRQFENKVLEGERPKSAPRDAQAVPIDGLVVGDKFNVQNWNFEVQDIEFDPDDDGRVTSVTLKDGPKFGVQTVEGREVIYIDEGTMRRNRKGRETASQGGEFLPGVARETPSPVAPPAAPAQEAGELPPTLKSGQSQGDLLGSGDVDFNLYGERTGDGERRAAEESAKAETERQAKAFADKHQQELRESDPLPDVLDVLAQDLYARDYASLSAEQQHVIRTVREERGVSRREQPGDNAGRKRGDSGKQTGAGHVVTKSARELQRSRPAAVAAAREELRKEIAYLSNEMSQPGTHPTVFERLGWRTGRAKEALRQLRDAEAEEFQKLEANPRWRELQTRYDRDPGSLSGAEREELRQLRDEIEAGNRDAVERILDQLKINIDPSQLHAFGLLPETWNQLIEIVRTAYRAGKTTAQAIRAGMDWLKEHGAKDYDEAGIRGHFDQEFQRAMSRFPKGDLRNSYTLFNIFKGDATTQAIAGGLAVERDDVTVFHMTAGTGSTYVTLTENQTGESVKIRYSDHFAPGGGGYRVTEMGSGREDSPDFNIVNNKIYSQENGKRELISLEKFRWLLENWLPPASEQANAPVAGGVAGIKTPSETQSQRPEGQADKGGVSALRTEGASALTSENKPESSSPVNSTSDVQPSDRIESALNRAIEATDFKPGQVNEGVTGAPVWLTKAAANGALRILRAAYRAGKTITQAIGEALEFLRNQNLEGFNETEAQAWLQTQTAAEKAPGARERANAIGEEMAAHEARGEAIPEELLARYKEAADELGEEIRTGREKTGQGRARVDENLQEQSTSPRPSPQSGEGERRIPQWRGSERLPGGRLRDLLAGLVNWRSTTGNWISRRGARAETVRAKDYAENKAGLSANELTNRVRLILNRAFGAKGDAVRHTPELRAAAIPFFIEANGSLEQLQADWEMISASEFADSKAGRQALAAIEYAVEHWDKFNGAFAQEFRNVSEMEREMELNEGLNVPEWNDGYIQHLWERDKSGAADPTRPQPAGTPFTKKRSYKTYAEGIANGMVPQSLDGFALLSNRIKAGQMKLNELRWVHGLRNMTDPVTDEPVVVDVIRKPRKPIQTQGSQREDPESASQAWDESYKPQWQVSAPPGYTVFRLGELEVAVQEGFAGLLTKLTAPSFFTGSKVKKAFGFAKSALLMFDTFHLGRLAAWKGVITGNPFTYGRGQTLLDFTESDIREMARRGEIPASWTDGLLENKRLLNLALQSGYNVGNVLDNAWGDVLHDLPGIGTFNKWLFGEYQRGAMAEAWLIEFQRMSKMLPNATAAQVARRVSADLNARFGNLNRQGLIKSRTMQDFARFVFLAPQWNESLIRSELGALGQTLKAPYDSVQQRRIVAGTLMRATGAMALGTFLANQILNYAFRGKPTWENEEEGFDKKISAYIPDVMGNGPGFFLNPLALPAEYTHLIEGNLHKSNDEAVEALRRIFASRLHPGARAAEIFMTRKDALGRKLRDGEVLPAMAKALTPIPIAAPTLYGAGKQALTGQPGETYPGQFQKQAMASFGVKTDQAPGAEQRMRSLAQRFNKEHGIEPSAEFYAGDFTELTRALRLGNETDARDLLDDVLKKKTARQVYEHYQRWSASPFTGQKGREKEFWRGLTEEQRARYLQARKERQELAKRAAGMLRVSR